MKNIRFAHHRNGSGISDPFVVALFDWQGWHMTATFKPAPTAHATDARILNVDLLAQGNIKFGENSYDPQDFMPELMKAYRKQYPDYYAEAMEK